MVEEPKVTSKYNARKVKIDGYTFDSMAESKRYLQLKQKVEEGVIKDLEVHPRFVLQNAFLYGDKRISGIWYEADFSYTVIDGRKIVEDVKGYETDVYRLKRKLLLYNYLGIEFKEISAKDIGNGI